MIAKYTNIGIIKDNKGNEVEVSPFRFLSKVVIINIIPECVPIGCLAKDNETGLVLLWVDDEFAFHGIMKQLVAFNDGDEDNAVIDVIDKTGYELKAEVKKETAEYLAIAIKGSRTPIASGMITVTGFIEGYWVDKGFRGSKSLRDYTAVLLRDTLQQGFMVENGVDKLRTKVYIDNVDAINARKKFGFIKDGILEENGNGYRYSSISVADCIESTKELIRSGR